VCLVHGELPIWWTVLRCTADPGGQAVG